MTSSGDARVTVSRACLERVLGNHLPDFEVPAVVDAIFSAATRSAQSPPARKASGDRVPTYVLLSQGLVCCGVLLHVPTPGRRGVESVVASVDERPGGWNITLANGTIVQDREPLSVVETDPATQKAYAELLYSLYPRHVGKQAATRAIRKALRERPVEYLLDAVVSFRDSQEGRPVEDRGFIPHPATWFNQGRYEDDRGEWSQWRKEKKAGADSCWKAWETF